MSPLGEAFSVRSVEDTARVRRAARAMATASGFDAAASEAIVLSAMELATNLLRYATGGEIRLDMRSGPGGTGLVIETSDDGPGIEDLGAALKDGFSTSGGLGSGLPAVKRLMDEFDIESTPSGTRTVATRWLRHE